MSVEIAPRTLIEIADDVLGSNEQYQKALCRCFTVCMGGKNELPTLVKNHGLTLVKGGKKQC